jgi:hypothetical protein
MTLVVSFKECQTCGHQIVLSVPLLIFLILVTTGRTGLGNALLFLFLGTITMFINHVDLFKES